MNDPPVAQSQTAVAEQGVALDGTLVATDVDSSALSFSLVDAAAHGTVAIAADGTFTHTSNPHFHGNDQFTFVANDGGSTPASRPSRSPSST